MIELRSRDDIEAMRPAGRFARLCSPSSPSGPGLVIAIEPWFLAGSPKILIDGDGWTIRSVDRSRGVHVEHTVAITADGPLVLTARDAVAASAPVRATA